ncbi:hypothetical protein TNCV_3734911 [Trichonephila clavipes]|nr:hypothetical protein TNCV_3734911 [Trichonephila clavipes]
MIFSDESRFSVTSDSGHQLLWRQSETPYWPKFVCDCDWNGPGVLVRTGIMHDGRTPNHIFLDMSEMLVADVLLKANHPSPYSTIAQNHLERGVEQYPQGLLDSLVKSTENRSQMCISVRSQQTS